MVINGMYKHVFAMYILTVSRPLAAMLQRVFQIRQNGFHLHVNLTQVIRI